ncbi:MAG: ATP-binding protein [Flavobacteriaceae bacterium]
MTILPASLAGRLTLFVLGALAVAQIVVFLLFAGERAQFVREAYRENVTGRTIELARSLAALPEPDQPHLLSAASSRSLRFWVAPVPSVEETANDGASRFVAREIAGGLNLKPGDVRAAVTTSSELRRPFFRWRSERQAYDADDEGDHGRGHRDRDDERRWLAIAVRLPGGWLNAVTGPPPPPPPYGQAFVLSLGLSSLLVGLVVFFAARRIARPIRRLAEGAERVGRGDHAVELPEVGPLEVRRLTHAFNEMRGRVDRFIADRTRMLAAISHDLRSPITALRLRAELVEDEETREKLVQSVGELQEMAEAALTFAKADAARPPSTPTDLGALLQSLTDDMADTGSKVTFEADRSGRPRALILARPGDIRRALRNIVDNAVFYGGGAALGLTASDGGFRILVVDHGPGIDEARREEMFQPFVRGEASRSRETGGIGLGLAIARDIIRAHGGDIALETTPGGGLTVVIDLPGMPEAAGR